MKMVKLIGALVLSVSFLGKVDAQCQQHVISTVPATMFSTWEYQDCETGEILTHSLPCCGWTFPFCAVVGSVQLIAGDGFSAVLINEVGDPWESCIPYNEPAQCVDDLNEDGIVNVADLLIFLSESPGAGEMAGFLQNYGTICDE